MKIKWSKALNERKKQWSDMRTPTFLLLMMNALLRRALAAGRLKGLLVGFRCLLFTYLAYGVALSVVRCQRFY